MRLRTGLGVTAAVLAVASAPAAGILPTCTTTWNGPAAGGSWNGNNWSGNGQPKPADHVCITGTGTVTVGQGVNVASIRTTGMRLQLDNSLTLATGVGDPSTLDGGVTLSANGSLSAGSGARLGALTMPAGTLDGGGAITLAGTGTFTWSGGTWQGAGRAVVADGATLTLSGAAKTLNRTLENHGQVTWNAGGLALGGGFGIENGSAVDPGAFTITDDLQLTSNGTTLGFTNSANSTVSKTAGSGATGAVVGVPLLNAGAVDIQSGTFQVIPSNPPAAPHTGSFQVASNTTLVVGGGTAHTFNGPISGPGTVNFTGGNVVVNGPYSTGSTIVTGTVAFNSDTTFPKFTQTSAGSTLGGTGTLTFAGGGPFAWTAGTWAAGGKVVIGDGVALSTAGSAKLSNRSIDNRGTFPVSVGNLTLGSGVTFSNGVGADAGTLQLDGTTQITQGGATPTIVNAPGSLISKTTAATTASVQPPVTNNGTVDVQAGDLTLFVAPTNQSGTTLTGGTFKTAGTLRWPSADVRTNVSSIELVGSGAIADSATGQNGLRNLATNAAAGSLTLTGVPALTSSAPIVNAGSISLRSGSKLTSSGSLTNTGTIDGDGTLETLGSGGRLLNQGLVRPGTGAGSRAVLTVTGAFEQSSTGTLEIDVAGTTPGSGHDQLAVSGASTLGGTLAIVTNAGFSPTVATSHRVLASPAVVVPFGTVTGRVGVVGGRYGVQYVQGAGGGVFLQFAPAQVTVTVPPTASLGTLGQNQTGSAPFTATVESTYRSGYSLGISRTAFGPGIPLRAALSGAPEGATLAPGVVADESFAIPVGTAATTFGTRTGGPATEAGLTPEGSGDQWLVTLTGGPPGWVQGGTYQSVVTVTAVVVP